MLAPALGRDVGDGPFQDFQEGLLDALAADVTGGRSVFRLAGDLVDLVDIDNPVLSRLDVKVRRLQKPHQDVFDVVAYIAGFGQSRRVGNRKGDV